MHCTVSFYLQTIGPNLDNAAVVKLKFIYSEKATQFCEIYILDLSYIAMVKSTVEILQTFVAFSEYMNSTNPYPYLKTSCAYLNWKGSRIDEFR